MSALATVHPLDLVHAANGTNGSKPPTGLVGYVEDSAFHGLLVDDEQERVRDVAWPQSVTTYSQMRTDSKLTAVLDGYKLQLRRAQWQVDGEGCRPEVTRLVGDDLGLPVKGHDEPGAARTRGVSWNDHLRAALTMLDYGHMGFELQAEMVDGKARLVGLWERPQHTIVTMHADPKTGEFKGISQELGRRPFDEASLKADRLAWFTHKREGAAWWGTSLIRPSFGPWLFKKEMMRVAATANRRFAMGVPTIKWAPSATPTPQQFSEAQKAVSAARVGDQSGVTLPPGAMLELVGLSGGTPDTMGFLQWLDQQMSGAVLMPHLDLGQTATGSRALGESFIDSWTLALESIGEEVADVATRQEAARIVAWNWGENEPVPRVVVSGIGSRREVTAQSLQLLLSSGGLAPDPALEEWIRREYRLPARTTPRPEPVAVPARKPATTATQEPAQSAKPAGVQASTAVAYEQPELLDVEAFNPGWKDQPRRKDRGLRDHGGRWVGRTGGASVTDRKPAAPTRAPATPKPERATLARSVASGVVDERSLVDEPLGSVDLVTFKDGVEAVRKTADENEADVEELSALVAEAVGVRAPRVHRDAPEVVVMDYMQGQPAVEVVGHWRDAPTEWTDTDDGRLLGLLDLLIDNQDRHNENWLINDGRIEAIDHNFAYQFHEAADEPPRPRSDFENHFINDSREPTWADNDLSPQDVAEIRRRLMAVRGEFERLGRGDWHAWSVARLNAIGAHASGRGSRLP